MRGMEYTSILVTSGPGMGINKRPYPSGPVDTSMPKTANNPYKWKRGQLADAYTESQVKMAMREEIEADLRAIYGLELPELELGVQRLTIGDRPAEAAAVGVEEEKESRQSPPTSTSSSEQRESDQSAQGPEPMRGVRRSGRKRKSTEKMLEAGKAQS